MPNLSGFSFVKFYFTIVSIVAVIGMVISYGIAGYNSLMHVVITDNEYIQGRQSWEIMDCKNRLINTKRALPTAVADGPKEAETREPTPEEIKTCEKEARARALTKRNFDTKESVIGGLVRGTLFLILFLTHYPRMMKLGRGE